MKFQVHAAADVMGLQHGTAPGGSGDSDKDRLGTILRVSGEQGLATIEHDGGIAVVLGANFQHGRRRQIVEVDATFNFRLHDVAIHFVAEVVVRRESGGQARQVVLPSI